MRIYEDSSKIRQLLMTSFPVENDDESKKFSEWLKILSWTFTCNNQICIILFLLGPGITGLRPCFQFSNWKKSTKTDSNWASKSCSILSRVHRIRWACPFFPTEKFGRSPKLKLKATNTLSFLINCLETTGGETLNACLDWYICIKSISYWRHNFLF